jgi:hypothetical protein
MDTNNAVNVRLAGSSGSGSFTGRESPALITPNLGTPSALVLTNATGDQLGTTTNNSAAALHVGEFVSNVRLSSSAISLTNATATDVTSISLTAGDWDVWGNVTIVWASANGVTGLCWISSTSATPPDASLSGGLIVLNQLENRICAPQLRFSLASTTTIYLSAFATTTGGGNTRTACGGIYARRVR